VESRSNKEAAGWLHLEVTEMRNGSKRRNPTYWGWGCFYATRNE